MNVVIDTHSLLWLVTNNKKLSRNARLAVRKASKVYIPTIVILELFYLMVKFHRKDYFPMLLENIKRDTKHVLVSLDMFIVEGVIEISYKLETVVINYLAVSLNSSKILSRSPSMIFSKLCQDLPILWSVRRF